MSEDTVSLAFQSDIVANVDVSAATAALDKLDKTIGDLEKRIRSVFDSLQSVTDTISDIGTRAVGARGKGWETERREVEKTVDSYKTMEITLQDVVARWSESIVKTQGRFPKKFEETVRQGIGGAVRTYEKTAGDIGDVRDKLLASAEKWAENEAKIYGRNADQTKNIVKAWMDVFDELVGHSVIPKLLNEMENQLVKRMEKILGDHAALIQQYLLPKDVSPDVMIRTYKIFIDAIEKEQRRLTSGFTKEADIFGGYAKKAGKAVKDLTDREKEQVVTALAVGREFGKIQIALRTYRDEIIGLPKTTPLDEIAKGLASYGKTIDTVTRQTDTLSRKLRESAEGIAKGLVDAFNTPPSLIAAKWDFIDKAIYKSINSTLAKLPMAASAQLSSVVREINKIENLLDDAYMATFKALLPHKGALKEFNDAWMALVNELGKAGKDAGHALMTSFKDAIVIETQETIGVVKTIATDVGDAMLDRFKYTMGGVFDVLALKGKEERLRSRLQRAIQFEMPKSIEHLEEEINQIAPVTKSAADATAHQMRFMRQSFGEAAGNIVTSVDSIINGNVRLRDGLSGIGIGFVQLGRVMGRHVGHTESMNTVSRRFNETLKFVTKSLSGYQREGEIVDKRLNDLATRTDKLSNHMKKGAEVLRKQQDLIRQDMKARQKAVAEYILSLDSLREAEQAGIKLTDERGKKLVAALQESMDKLIKLGVAEEVFGDVYEDLGKIRAELKATGSTMDASLTEKLRTTAVNAEKTFAGMENHLEKMAGNFPKAFSMMSSAIQSLTKESEHFTTTLRDGGKISTDRLQNMLLALQHFDEEMKEIQRLQAVDPASMRYWDEFRRNMLVEIENFALMSQRALAVQNAKEKLYGVTKKVTGAIKNMGQVAARHIPIIGEKAKVSSEQMEKFKSATGRVSTVTNQLSINLGQLDPVFSDLSMGAGNMGQVFGAAMEGMKEAAAVKTTSIVKSLTLIKIAASGIIGIFSGLIISTGKLAAEVTTLGITMRTVAKNVGVPIPYLEELQKTLEKTGITSRESISAITAWMRAKLPFEFEDAVSGMTYGLKDLARAAQEMAVAMGEDSSEMVSRFIDFIQTGNSNLLDAAGIMKTANQMYEEYAVAIHKGVKELTTHEKHLALMSGLIGESATLTGVYEEAMKSAGKQLGSMRRYIEQLRLEWGKQFEPVIAWTIFHLNQLIQILTKIPEKTKQTIATLVAAATAMSGLALALGVVLPKLNAFLGITKLISKLIFTKFGLIFALVSLVAGAFAKMFMNIDAEGEGLEGIVNRIDKLLESFGGLSRILQPIMDWVSNFSKMVRYHFELIGSRIGKFVENVRNKIKEFLEEHPEIESFLVRAKEVFGDLFSVIWRVVDQVLGAVEALLDQDWETFFEKLRTAGQYILAWMFEFFNEVVKSAFEWGYNIISSFVSGLIQYGRIAIPRAMTAIGNLIASFLEGHSPAKIGPLSKIDLWGGGLMSAFERGLRQKRILFDEDMFLGLSSLNAKARLWGDNITDTFASGIAGRAATAVVPAMDAVGEMIARFLEGHSPPAVGRLAEIEDWGRNAFETFLAGFEMADYSILDQALSLVQSRMQTLVDSAKEAGPEIARAMMQVREAVAGAIFQARVTGGPLDLGGLRNIMVGTLEIYAADIAAVLEASFAAAEAQKAVQALQDQIAAAQQARQDAIQAAQDVLEGIQDQIKAKEKEVEALNEQMEAEIEARARAIGIFVDEKLMNALQRELERANVEVEHAQRRLDRVRSQAGKYGMNILSWEEINANTQLQLAKDRQAVVQDQINVEEEKQRQMDELREDIEERYKKQFDALEAEIEVLQERAEAQQEHIEAMRKADQAASRAEQEQLRAAQQHAKELAEHADLLNKALEERMKAEEEARKAIEGTVPEEGGAGLPTPKWERPWKPEEIAGPEIPYTPPSISEMLKEWFGKLEIDFEGGIPGIVEGIREKIKTAWANWIETPLGQWSEEIGGVAFWETVVSELGEIWDRFVEIFGTWGEIWDKVRIAIGLEEGDIGQWFKGALGWLNEKGGNVVEIISELVQLLLDLFSLDGEAFLEDLDELGFAFLDLIGDPDKILEFFDELPGKIEDWVEDIKEGIGEIVDAFLDLPEDIWNAIKGLWKKIIAPFKKADDELVGNSIVPDMIDDIVGFFIGLPGEILSALGNFVKDITQPFRDVFSEIVGPDSIIGNLVGDVVDEFENLPGKITGFAGDFLKSAQELGKNIYDGISGKVTEVKDNIGGWMTDVGDKIGEAAGTFWSKATEVATSAYDAINGKIAEAKDNMPQWMTDVANKITDAASEFWNKATQTVTNVYNAIRDKLTGTGGESVSSNIVSWMVSIATKIVQSATEFYNRAWTTAQQIYNGFRDLLFGENGLFDRFGDWILALANNISDFAEDFYDKAYLLGEQVGLAIRTALEFGLELIALVIRNVWNNVLRGPFNNIIRFTCEMVNGVIDILNSLWRAIDRPPSEYFPIDTIPIPELPELAVGGIVMSDTLAKLHAGEIVLPLDRLGDVLRNLGGIQGVPAFSPILNFYPGSSPQQVMPAIHQAYDWYTEEMRRG